MIGQIWAAVTGVFALDVAANFLGTVAGAFVGFMAGLRRERKARAAADEKERALRAEANEKERRLRADADEAQRRQRAEDDEKRRLAYLRERTDLQRDRERRCADSVAIVLPSVVHNVKQAKALEHTYHLGKEERFPTFDLSLWRSSAHAVNDLCDDPSQRALLSSFFGEVERLDGYVRTRNDLILRGATSGEHQEFFGHLKGEALDLTAKVRKAGQYVIDAYGTADQKHELDRLGRLS